MNNINFKNYLKNYPNKKGFFGKYGGVFTPQELEAALNEITRAYFEISKTKAFKDELKEIQAHFQGRPTPTYYAKRLSNHLGNGNKLFLKREDLNHTGAHKLNHCMGEALVAKKMGKTKLIAETGAGQHGVAIATAAAYFNLQCEVHMGEVDVIKQANNVSKMKILGAKIIVVKEGDKTLKEAVDSAFNAYLNDYQNSLYAIGSVVGPHPFPKMVRDFQSIVGKEAKKQILKHTNKLPDYVIACVGGGSNAMGIFSAFIETESVNLIGVEALGKGASYGLHSAAITYGKEGIMHGFNSLMLKDNNDNPAQVYSIASGLDYPSVGPEHALLHDLKKVAYKTVSDKEALEAFFLLSKLEGIIPALESSHALAYAFKLAKKVTNKNILINLSGRGDKDVDFVIENYPHLK
ncbi:MAG: tryptophan synthase subunit beta [Acholeplasmataceae bacterium]|nr:tryptophan synthase subunit beta [Acholeplasmataceae bacterium]MCK9289634.1 tryptophan synthase subunit beta [Acholeplasmataceae bacterium]MCK9427612.1 tryptophan synthase subunit beta [Acholeplasmataceae bacterium]